MLFEGIFCKGAVTRRGRNDERLTIDSLLLSPEASEPISLIFSMVPASNGIRAPLGAVSLGLDLSPFSYFALVVVARG